MSRRTLILLACVAVFLGLGLFPWPIASPTVRSAVARQIRNEYGLRLGVDTRATLALLPVPRLRLQNVQLSDDAGSLKLVAGQLKAELRVVPLLAARLRIAELRITDTAIDIRSRGGAPAVWMALTDELRSRMRSGESWSSRIDRLVVTNADITVSDEETGAKTEFRAAAALVKWPDPAGDLDMTANGQWRGQPVSMSLAGLNPARLMAGEPDPFEFALVSHLGRINASGRASWRDTPRFDGELEVHAPSFGAMARWTGLGRDLRELDMPVTVKGTASADTRAVEWPRGQMDLDGSRLEGAIGFRVDADRPQFRATLAGDELDLGWIIPIADPRRSEQPQADYDVRLSALALKFGPLRLRDAAAGILVGGDRIEVSLARAGLAGGQVRGRLLASLDGEARDIKGQVTLDKVDIDTLLAEWGAQRRMTGTLGGQANFDLIGDRQPDMSQQIRGRIALKARDGEIAGISLPEIARRTETRPGVSVGGGKTRYGAASITLELGNGIADIAEGFVDTASTHTDLTGQFSLATGTVAVRTVTRPSGGLAGPEAQPRPPVVLDLKGPLAKPSILATDIDATAAPAAARPKL